LLEFFVSTTSHDGASGLFEAAPAPELCPLTEAFKFIGLRPVALKRLEASDPAFPRLIRLSTKKVLVDIPAAAAYLRAQAGKAPRSMRAAAEAVAAARKAANDETHTAPTQPKKKKKVAS